MQNHPRFKARDFVVKALDDLGLMRGKVAHAMSLPICSRSGDVIEPMAKTQWFVRCDVMASKAVAAVSEGSLKIEPESGPKIWNHWLSNIKSVELLLLGAVLQEDKNIPVLLLQGLVHLPTTLVGPPDAPVPLPQFARRKRRLVSLRDWARARGFDKGSHGI